mgnify:CR=1 FL=1
MFVHIHYLLITENEGASEDTPSLFNSLPHRNGDYGSQRNVNFSFKTSLATNVVSALYVSAVARDAILCILLLAVNVATDDVVHLVKFQNVNSV